jgi:hypothetical protein
MDADLFTLSTNLIRFRVKVSQIYLIFNSMQFQITNEANDPISWSASLVAVQNVPDIHQRLSIQMPEEDVHVLEEGQINHFDVTCNVYNPKIVDQSCVSIFNLRTLYFFSAELTIKMSQTRITRAFSSLSRLPIACNSVCF